MGKHLILAGGGHAHMVTLAKLDRFVRRGHRVSVVSPSNHHYYSGMGPGMLGRTYTPEQIRFDVRRMVERRGGDFIRDSVTRIDPARQMVYLQSGASLRYDLLSCNTGSHVPNGMSGGGAGRVYTVKPIERLTEAGQRIADLAAGQRVRVAVIGGGAAGVEVAGNVWRLLSSRSRGDFEVRIFSGARLLERFPEKVRTAAMASLRQRGIGVFENRKVRGIERGRVDLGPGRVWPADVVFLATGVRPSAIFQASGLPIGPDGGLLVNRYLHSTEYANLFGGGDCIHYQEQPLEKVGVYAVRQNPVLFHNLMATLENRPLKAFDTGGAYLLIFNMGDGTGVFYKNGVLLKGRPAFLIKDWIDRRFMRKFQSKG